MQISAGSGIPDGSLILKKFSSAGQSALSNMSNQAAHEHIRRLIAGTTTYGTDKKDLWGDAFIDSDGRNNSVSAGDTTAVFNTNKYQPIVAASGSADTKNGTNSTSTGDTVTISATAAVLGIVKEVYCYFQASGNVVIKNASGSAIATKASGGTGYRTVTFATTDYSEFIPAGNFSIQFASAINKDTGSTRSHAGTKWSFTNQNYPESAGAYISYDSLTISEALLTLTIPANTYPAAITAAHFKTLVSNDETGTTLQWKLTNATEDTGYFNDGQVGDTFTPFTSTPTKLILKLTPKASSPSVVGPAIYGVAGAAW